MDQASTTEQRRLAILRHLEALAQYVSNDAILADVLRGIGISTTGDQLRSTLAWLQEQDLVRLDEKDDFLLVEITGRGAEAARGEVRIPGVARPRPRT